MVYIKEKRILQKPLLDERALNKHLRDLEIKGVKSINNSSTASAKSNHSYRKDLTPDWASLTGTFALRDGMYEDGDDDSEVSLESLNVSGTSSVVSEAECPVLDVKEGMMLNTI